MSCVKQAELTQLYSRVESPVGTEQVQGGLAIVTLARPVDLRLRKDEQGGSLGVPLELDLVALEEALLRHRRTELRYIKHLDRRRLSLTS